MSDRPKAKKRQTKCLPPIPLWDSKFIYVPAVKTNVQETWARHGWVSPSKNREPVHEHA